MPLFTNQATLSYNGTSVNSNIVTGNLIETLAMTKTSVTDIYSANNDVTYIISITNTGTTAFTGITLTDDLGEYDFGTETVTPLDYVEGSVLYYQNGIVQAAPAVTDTEPLTITGITVPAGGNAMIIYEAIPNAFAPLNASSTITNTATITGPSISTPITAEETVSVDDELILSITKSLSPVNVTENSEITYTFTIQNTGNTAGVVTDNIIITDTFDPALSDITVTVNGEVLPATSYSYNEATGEFATDIGAITVPAATYTQDPVTGEWIITPGVTVVTVIGTI